MSLLDLEGNENIAYKLVQAVKSNTISHAYIFEGDACIDKLLLADNFVKAILCENHGGDACETCLSCIKINHGNHEDLIYVRPEGNSIKDEAVEEMQYRLLKKPYAGDRNVVIIENADSMTLRAQNRLLKTLEEPALGTVIILLSDNRENLTQTIQSRCIVFKLNPFHTPDFQDTLEAAANISDMLLENRNFQETSARFADYAASREKALELLDALESWYRDFVVYEYDETDVLLFHKDHMDEIEKKSRLYKKSRLNNNIQFIEEARNDINRNLNISYTLKNMVLKMSMQ